VKWLLLSLAACGSPVLEASRGTPKLDGDMNDPQWLSTATTGAWKGDKIVAFTEARVLWDDDAVYLGLYMSDENIGAGDVVEVNVDGDRRTLHPFDTSVYVEDNEEWMAELEFPRHGDSFSLELSRTDTPVGGDARTSHWRGKVRLKR
jgi:hypothetical protein